MSIAERLRAAAVRAVGPVIAATALWLLGRNGAAVVVFAGAGFVLVVGLVAPLPAATFDRLLGRVAGAAATAVAYLLGWAGWLVGVLPAWAIGRVSRRNGIGRTRAGTQCGWFEAAPGSSRTPDGAPMDPNRSGSDHQAPAGERRTLAHVRLAVGAAVIVALVATVAVVRSNGTDGTAPLAAVDEPAPASPPAPTQPPVPAGAIEWDGLVVDDYAHEAEPWALAFFQELGDLPVLSDPFLGHRLRDSRGRYLNTRDGHRVSYTPDEPELTVWFFGGSTMFGIGQRDDHTLPSVIARLAKRDGIRIRAVNFGVNGYENWRSLEQFEQALTSDREPPDLAVFYEGINDWGLGNERAERGDLRPGSISRFAVSEEEREVVRNARDATDPMPIGPERDEAAIDQSAAQYRRGSELIDRLAASFDVPVARFWQPSPFAKRPQPSDERLWERLDFKPAWLPEGTRQYNAMRIRSGVDTVDLTTVFDEIDRPIYFDGGHTNEFGARIVSEAMYEHLEPQFRSLADD